MKCNFKFLVLLSAGIMTNAFADTATTCPQGNSAFLQVAQAYTACNSVVGADQAACNKFCEDSDKLLGSSRPAPAEQYCSPEQIRTIQAQARNQGIIQGTQQGRDEVLRDLSAREDFISAEYFGINEDDCARRVSQATQNLRIEAIKRCNDKAVTIKNCVILNEKVSGSFGRPPKFEGNGSYQKDDRASNQEDCQKSALADATKIALQRCTEATGYVCTVNQAQTILTHRLQQPGGLRLGRRDQRICEARVSVEAAADLGYKCNAKISARNQAFAN